MRRTTRNGKAHGDIPGMEMALFRYATIAPLLQLEGGPRGERQRLIREISRTPQKHPSGETRRVPFGTLKDWVRAYRTSGFDGLLPKQRADRGRARRLTDVQVEEILRIRRGLPTLTVVQIQERLIMSGAIRQGQVSVPTLHRLFRRHDVTRAALLDREPGQDRRPYQFGSRNDCWQVDAMAGPAIGAGPRKRRASLIAFIDDATRVVPSARFGITEDVGALAGVFVTGVTKRGIPGRLYSDNGKIFRSHALRLACARLGVEQIHARPYSPEGKGKIERFFRTLRDGFLNPYLVDHMTIELDALNEALERWLDAVYHVRGHRGLNGRSPIDAWVADEKPLRTVDPNCDMAKLFLSAQGRTVRRDCTIAFRCRRYEVPPAYRNKKVVIRFDGREDGPVHLQDSEGNLIPLRLVDLIANRTIVRKKAGEA